jgi:hypothetical protein
VLTTVLISVTNAGHAVLSAYHAAFFTGALLVVCGALSGLLIHDEDAASTLQRPRRPAVDEGAAAAPAQ